METEQMKNKLEQYVNAYNHVVETCNALQQAIKTINSTIEMAPSCYFVNETDICGNYLRDISDRLVNKYNYIVDSVLPQARSLVDFYKQAVTDAMQKDMMG